MLWQGCGVLRVALATAAIFTAFAVVAGAADQTVTFSCCSYSPREVRIAPGEKVTWSGDFGAHPLRSDDAAEPYAVGPEDPPPTFTNTFEAPGRYPFQCQIHGPSGMTGEVTVSANNPPAASFTPSGTTVASGTEVTFTSESSDPDAGQTLSYAWDLDGDGQLNDSDVASPARTYTNAGTTNQTITVRLRVTDSNAEPEIGPESSSTTREITVTPAGGQQPPAEQPPTITPPVNQDRTAPVVRITSRTLTVRRGLAVARLTLSEAGSATVRLRRGAATFVSRRLSLFAGRRTLRLRLNAAGRRALAKSGRLSARLTVQVRDGAGNTGTATRTLTFRRG